MAGRITSLMAGMAAVLGMAGTASAEPFQKWALDISGGTGFGANVQTNLNDWYALRAGFQVIPYDIPVIEINDLDYDGTFDFYNVGAFLDFHPFRNGFTITGGIMHGRHDLDVVVTGTDGAIRISGATLPNEAVGQLNGVVSWRDHVPFAGIGYDNSMYTDRQWTMALRLGVMFTDEPRLEITGGEGPLIDQLEDVIAGLDSIQRQFLSNRLGFDIERGFDGLFNDVEEDANEEFEDYPFLPYAQVAVGYRF